MSYHWGNLPIDLRKYIYLLNEETKELIGEGYVGTYIHGSLALGGFLPKSSDVDLLLIVSQEISKECKKNLTDLFLKKSGEIFPIEISILSISQLNKWEHPSKFEYHYSEYWRDFHENNKEFQEIPVQRDPDLAAHLTIINQNGIAIEGPDIVRIFPPIPKEHYIQALIVDVKDGLDDIQENPIYFVLNLLRVYKYMIDGSIIGKKEAGEWGVSYFPLHKETINTALQKYQGKCEFFNLDKLLDFQREMQRLLTPFVSNEKKLC